LMCILHGVTMLQVDAIPICGFEKSASVKPTARNMARPGACSTPSTTIREYRRGSGGPDCPAALRLDSLSCLLINLLAEGVSRRGALSDPSAHWATRPGWQSLTRSSGSVDHLVDVDGIGESD
jgi:hypothetical protein